MIVACRKKPSRSVDLDTIVDKIRAISFKKRWEVTYSTNKEDSRTLTVEADTYTGAYLAFMITHAKTDEITEIKEV